MAVNRMRSHFFGHGLVEPVDDFSDNNPPSHPGLLDELARNFVQHSFDLKYLIRATTASETYQRTCRQSHGSQADPALFARMTVRASHWNSCLTALLKRPARFSRTMLTIRSCSTATQRAEFLTLFQDEIWSPTERQTTILQALSIMNGQFISDATNLENSRTLTAIGVTASQADTRLELLGGLEYVFLKDWPGVPGRSHQVPYRQAVRMMKSERIETFSLYGEPDALRDAYGRNQFS